MTARGLAGPSDSQVTDGAFTVSEAVESKNGPSLKCKDSLQPDFEVQRENLSSRLGEKSEN